ncbi:TetR/AcrR family transcriptional regulator [Actinomadura rudentiformis]|uniref:TetR/AcrR family transcriptional regulator n=1 Tax=Actinomadura rudentiformis TaxID=359158 RepID=A0A6H9YHT9_9ACTN|nr:TetR/AcrR family transcriptional regulator [Actinomadura rudentiformis]KAB2343630.1 TetR/AcrR family transcriptional regulator [Actinomadura rudentiformis]
MSEISASRRRRRRADADRSAAAVLQAAQRVLASEPHASIEDIATAAGVSRQTVYAHFGNRDALVRAVIDAITAETVAEMDTARLDEGSAAEALLRLLDVSWRPFQRYMRLLNVEATTTDDERAQHRPVVDHLQEVLTRGQRSGEFTRDLSATWLATATVSLGHAAGEAVTTGQMTIAEAARALAWSLLRLCGVEPSRITELVDRKPSAGSPVQED